MYVCISITELMVFIFIDSIYLPCFQNCLVAILFSYFLIFVSFDVALSGLARGINDLKCIYAARYTTCRLTLVLSPTSQCTFFCQLLLLSVPLLMPLKALLVKTVANVTEICMAPQYHHICSAL